MQQTGIKGFGPFYHCNMAFTIADITSIIKICKQRLFSLFISLSKFKQQTFIVDYYATVVIMILPKV